MTLNLNKDIDEIVAPPRQQKINWLLVASVALGTTLAIIVIGWFAGFVAIGSSQIDTAGSDTAIVNGEAPRIKGNRMSRIYHLPRCQNYDDIAPRNIRWFNSEENALAAKYRRARNC